jgi:hypothetical protein
MPASSGRDREGAWFTAPLYTDECEQSGGGAGSLGEV